MSVSTHVRKDPLKLYPFSLCDTLSPRVTNGPCSSPLLLDVSPIRFGNHITFTTYRTNTVSVVPTYVDSFKYFYL